MDKQIEQQQFLDLCEYVHKDLLEYDEGMKFPKHLALRLRGLHKGQFLANNNIKPMASYSYESILLTFKISKFDILSKIRQKDKFKDEKHRINYMMVIIENNINDVVLKMKKNKKAKEKSQTIEINDGVIAEYHKKTQEVKSNKLKDLW